MKSRLWSCWQFGLSILAVTWLMFGGPPTSYAGIVSYWTFDDGTAVDTVGSNDGVFGSLATAYSSGIIGGAVDLAGQPNNVNANVTVAAGHTMNTATASANSLTMEAWFTADDIHTNTYTEIMRQQGPGYRFLSFQNYGKTLSFTLESSKFDITGLTAADFEDGDWHHVVATYDGSEQRVYIDGQLQGTKSVALTLSSSSPPAFVIGNLNLGTTYSESFDGRIDEVAVWDEAISSDEVLHQWINRQSYTTRLAGYNTTTSWNVHDDWDSSDGIPNDPPDHAWHYQVRSAAGVYTDLTGWSNPGWWTGKNARTNSGGYPLVGPVIENFDHLESTVDAYVADHGLASMDLIDMHPGSSDDQTAVVTWRNPVPGTNMFYFDGVFWHIDDTGTNGVDVSIRQSEAFGVNDTLLSELVTGLSAQTVTLNAADTSLPDNAAFSFYLTLDYGDELHFLVNARGSHGSDATMFGLIVQMVPEPSLLPLVVSGTMIMGVWYRRRRRRQRQVQG